MSTSRSSKRKSHEERTQEARDTIIEASFVCLGKFGYQNTSLSRIAMEARCSKELPRYHFGSKDDLVDFLLTRTAQEWGAVFVAPLKNNLSGIDALWPTLELFGDKFTENAGTLRGQLALILAASDPSNVNLTERFQSFQTALRRSVKKALTEGSNTSTHKKEDIDQLVVLFLAASRGIAFQWMVDPESINVKASFLKLLSLIEKDLAKSK